MIEIEYLFGKMILNTALIFTIENGYEQEYYTLIINDKVIPFESKDLRDKSYKRLRNNFCK